MTKYIIYLSDVYFVVIVIIPSLVNAMMLVISVHRYETQPALLICEFCRGKAQYSVF